MYEKGTRGNDKVSTNRVENGFPIENRKLPTVGIPTTEGCWVLGAHLTS